VAAKLESFNPGSSVKDRVGLALVEAGEESGELRPGGTILQPTSGNTGIGIAMAANLKGYRLICTAPDKIPPEKIALLEAFGAEVILCPTKVSADDPSSYYRVAERLRDETGGYLPSQYHHPANPTAHWRTTGPEIWRQTEGTVTHWVAGMGTGGTLSGTARFLKEQNPEVRVVGVDTEGSVYAYYHRHGHLPPQEERQTSYIDGIGQDFMPDTVWWEFVDEVVTVDDASAYRASLELARKESIFAGSSAGAAAAAARALAATLPPDSLVVTLFPDSGERYLSRFDKRWMESKGFL
jgi:cystathionine beta-synthase